MDMKTLNKGFTLVELMVTLAVLAIILTIAVPSFSEALNRYRLKAVAESFMGGMYIAKAEAMRTGKPVYFSVSPTAACYGFNVGSACDCSTASASQCTMSTTTFSAGQSVSMAGTTVAGNSGYFEPVRGTVTSPGNVSFQNSTGLVIKSGVSSVGRVSSCSPAGSTYVRGYVSTNC